MFTQEEIDKSVEVMDHVYTLALLEFNRLYSHYRDPRISSVTHEKNAFHVYIKTYSWGESDETQITIFDTDVSMSVEEYKEHIEEMILEQKRKEEAERKLEIIQQEKIKIQREKQRLKDEKLLYEKLKLKYEK